MTSESDLRELETLLGSSDPLNGDPVLSVIKNTFNENPRWTLKDIMTVLSSQQDIELNALDLIPLLWDHTHDEDAIDLLKLISTRSSSKECIIALQEVQEILFTELMSYNPDDHEDNGTALALVDRLSMVSSLIPSAIPRLNLRKKGPLDTLKPILKSFTQDVQMGSLMADKGRGRALLEAVADLVSASVLWLETLTHTSEEEHPSCIDGLSALLLSSVASCCSHIQSRLADEYIESRFPRRYLHSTINSDSSAGRELGSKLVKVAKLLHLGPAQLLKLAFAGGQIALAGIVLVVHWPTLEFSLNLQQLGNLEPHVETFLQKGVAVDEMLYFILKCANTPGSLQADGLVQYLVSLSSSSPDETQRNIAFVTLSVLLKKMPAPPRLARLAELLSPDDPLPQMRVAAVALVKESILDALVSPEPDLFASKELFTQIGRFLLRPDPADLFENNFNGDTFLSTAEPARLTECLGLYYTILRRDTSNKTGIRNRASIADTKRSLLEPLSRALDGELTRQAEGIDESSISVISLSLALERVYDALQIAMS